MRKRLFEVIEIASPGDTASLIYDVTMLFVIIISIIPLAFKQPLPIFYFIEIFTTALFILDYFLRWITADYKLNKRSGTSFIQYIFTSWAIIDLLSILPSLTFLIVVSNC